jgi:hypothetical protein
MPNRYLREGIISSPRVNALSRGAELLYRRLHSVVDDYGRYFGSPGTIRAGCWPLCPERVSDDEIVEWLRECSKGSRPLIVCYEVDSLRYIEITNFRQTLRSASKFPPNPATKVQKVSKPAENGKSKHPATTEELGRFPEWWKVWSEVRGTNHHTQAYSAWVSVVQPDLVDAVFECVKSYLASLENPNKGYNPENFLLEQAKDRFSARWPARVAPAKATANEKAKLEWEKRHGPKNTS